MGLRRHLAALALVGAADAAVRVACLGDSITKGGHGSDEDDDDHADSYPEFLGALLGDGYDVRNYGSSGKTAADYGTDESNPYRETPNWDDALDDGFDIAVVMLGTNDAKEDNWDRDTFVAQYGALLAETKARAAALVALLPVPYVPGDEFSASSKWGDDPSVMNEALPAATLDAFEEDGAAPDVVVSLWDAFGGDDPDLSLYDDAIHPNQKGYERIAETVYAEGLLAVAAGAPTYQPSTYGPSYAPSYAPTRRPTTARPTRAPSTQRPSPAPSSPAPSTLAPSRKPTTAAPSATPSTAAPSYLTPPPTAPPSTLAPSSARPSSRPSSAAPSATPSTAAPSAAPSTARPSAAPSTAAPSLAPVPAPTAPPSSRPSTARPSASPSPAPSPSPSANPSPPPSAPPSPPPSPPPSAAPSPPPSPAPSPPPSSPPSLAPSATPSRPPSPAPSASPTPPREESASGATNAASLGVVAVAVAAAILGAALCAACARRRRDDSKAPPKRWEDVTTASSPTKNRLLGTPNTWRKLFSPSPRSKRDSWEETAAALASLDGAKICLQFDPDEEAPKTPSATHAFLREVMSTPLASPRRERALTPEEVLTPEEYLEQSLSGGLEDDASDGDVELVDGGLGDDASDGEVELVRVDEKSRAVDVDVGDDFPDRAPTDSPDTVIHDRVG